MKFYWREIFDVNWKTQQPCLFFIGLLTLAIQIVCPKCHTANYLNIGHRKAFAWMCSGLRLRRLLVCTWKLELIQGIDFCKLRFVFWNFIDLFRYCQWPESLDGVLNFCSSWAALLLDSLSSLIDSVFIVRVPCMDNIWRILSSIMCCA